MSYTITLTEEETTTIAFVGGRYSWSEALGHFETGENELTEPDAWELAAAFDQDTEGGHSPFPMLDPTSDLYLKLQIFWDSIV
jgi:hypothetical protein